MLSGGARVLGMESDHPSARIGILQLLPKVNERVIIVSYVF